MSRIKLCIVSNLYHPDELGGAALMTDFAAFMKEAGMEVNVVTTFSYYPNWKLKPQDRGVWKREETIFGIPVARLRMYVPGKVSTSRRLASDLSFMFSLLFLGRRYWKDADLVVTACPMFGQCLAVRLSSSAPKMVIVQDFVVDSAIELNMIRVPFAGGFLRSLERWCLKGFDTLTSISDDMHKKLVSIVGTGRRTLYVPNWIHGSLNSTIERVKLSGPERRQGVLFYSGNVGRKQGLHRFIGDFDGVSTGWKLDIQGGGAELDALLCACAGREDVHVGGLRAEEDYIRSMMSSSACLITQLPGVGANFLPSKILPALATGTPILAICEKDSPLGREISDTCCGEVIETGNPEAVKEVLLRWSREPELLKRYGENALARAPRYSRASVLGEFRDELQKLLCRK